ncbi:MAG: winged helix-turn-helix domain-containing protein [Bacteroidales bacterium]|nr:winged helix-turn-helix domain-containing protein [Bacteroidales bacterium]
MIKKRIKGSVLFVLNDVSECAALQNYFSRKHFAVFVAQNKKAVSAIIRNNALNFIITGSSVDAETVSETVKYANNFDNRIITLCICPDGETESRITALNLPVKILSSQKPVRNLLTQLNAMTTDVRENLTESHTTLFNIGKYTFHCDKSLLTVPSTQGTLSQKLTKKEASLLLLLCINKGKLVSRHRLMSDVWKKDDSVTAKSLNVYISRLRTYFGLDKSITLENKHSLGYILSDNNAV